MVRRRNSVGDMNNDDVMVSLWVQVKKELNKFSNELGSEKMVLSYEIVEHKAIMRGQSSSAEEWHLETFNLKAYAR